MGRSRNDKRGPQLAPDDTVHSSDTEPSSPTDASAVSDTETHPAPAKEKESGSKGKGKGKNSVGRPSAFQQHEIKWIRATFVEFDRMVLASTGTQEEKDAIKKWKEDKWKELFDTYYCSLKRPGLWKQASPFISSRRHVLTIRLLQKFSEVFKNRQSNYLKKKKEQMKSTKVAPLILLQGERTDAFHKFRAAKSKEITESINRESVRGDRASPEVEPTEEGPPARAGDEEGSRSGAGDEEGAEGQDEPNAAATPFITKFQTKLSQMWRSLTPAQRKEWSQTNVSGGVDLEAIFQ